jgi:predicted anti-sigma-YlaC factor YlaD
MKTTPKSPDFLAYRFIHALTGSLWKKLGLSCRQYFELCSDRLDRELTPAEKRTYDKHSRLCSVCRPVPGQFKKLREILRQLPDESEIRNDAESIPKETLQMIESKLRQHCSCKSDSDQK